MKIYTREWDPTNTTRYEFNYKEYSYLHRLLDKYNTPERMVIPKDIDDARYIVSCKFLIHNLRILKLAHITEEIKDDKFMTDLELLLKVTNA